MAKIDDLNKEIAELREQLGYIPQSPFKPEELQKAKEALKGLKVDLKDMGNDLDYIASSFRDSVNELSKQNTELSKSKAALRSISSISSTLNSFAQGQYSLSEKQLKSKITQAKLDFDSLKTSLESKSLKKEAQKEVDDALKKQKLFLDATEKILKKEEKINAALGLAPAIIGGIGNSLRKLGLPDFGIAESLEETKMILRADTKRVTIGKALGIFTKKIAGNINDQLNVTNLLTLAFVTLLKQAGKIDGELVSFEKNLMLSRGEAINLRKELAFVAQTSKDNLINTSDLVKAQQNFNELLGLQGKINNENLLTQAELTKKVGVSAESAANLQFFSEATGKDFNQQYSTLVGNTQQISAQYGIQLNQRQVLEEIGKTSSYNLIQFKGSTEELGKAVAEAKALGLTLEQIGKIQSDLVNFESSIRAELEAELLTGKQLNLERARFAALTNDISTLQNEIKEQVGDINDFQNMNFISQQKFAQALGMSVGEISDMLLLEEYRNANQSQINANLTEEQKERLASLTAQEKFNEAIVKLQGLVGDLVQGPLGNLIDKIGDGAALAENLKFAFMAITGFSFMKVISSLTPLITSLFAALGASTALASALTLGVGAAAVAAGILYMNSAVENSLNKMKSASKVNDMISPGYGKRVLSGPEGTFAFNDKDTIVAGTDLLPTTKPTPTTTQTTTVSPNMVALEQRMDKLISVVENALIPAVKQDKIFNLDGKQFAVATAVSRS